MPCLVIYSVKIALVGSPSRITHTHARYILVSCFIFEWARKRKKRKKLTVISKRSIIRFFFQIQSVSQFSKETCSYEWLDLTFVGEAYYNFTSILYLVLQVSFNLWKVSVTIDRNVDECKYVTINKYLYSRRCLVWSLWDW